MKPPLQLLLFPRIVLRWDFLSQGENLFWEGGTCSLSKGIVLLYSAACRRLRIVPGIQATANHPAMTEPGASTFRTGS